MTDARFERYKIEWIFIRDLRPHPRVQRRFNEKHAAAIAAAFDPDKFRALDVVPHGSKFDVFAGQHRLAAALQAFGGDQKVPCRIHPDTAIQKQAEICLGIDRMLPWHVLDRWRIRIMAEEEVPMKIEALLARHGLRVCSGDGEGQIAAVAALEAVFTKNGGELILDRILRVLQGAWNAEEHPNMYDGVIIRALGLLLHRLGDAIVDEHLARNLMRSGPMRLIGAGRDYARSQGFTLVRGLADKMLFAYNKGAKKKLTLE